MSKHPIPPFAVRLIGYSVDERAEMNRHFALHHKQGGSAFHALHEDNLADPDLYLVNVDHPDALATLERLRPAPARPALLVGSVPLDLPHLFLPAPASACELLDNLEKLLSLRADAFSRLPASELVHVPERRRKLVVGSGDVDFALLRREPARGGVLVVDKDAHFSQFLVNILGGRGIRVDRANEQRSAGILCKQLDVSLVFINTGANGIDPYRLCESIKAQAAHPLTVIFLAGRYFSYHADWARKAGCEGFVNKPLSERQVLSLLDRYLPAPPADES